MNMHMYIHKHICIYIYMTNTVVCYNAAAIFWNRPPPHHQNLFRNSDQEVRNYLPRRLSLRRSASDSSVMGELVTYGTAGKVEGLGFRA